VIRAMVAYPTVRLEPTERGSRFALYWVVRGACRHPAGWMTARARVAPLRALPTAWDLARDGLTHTHLAELETALRGRPGIRVTHWQVTPPDSRRPRGVAHIEHTEDEAKEER
jgi:hypothetical protein